MLESTLGAILGYPYYFFKLITAIQTWETGLTMAINATGGLIGSIKPIFFKEIQSFVNYFNNFVLTSSIQSC